MSKYKQVKVNLTPEHHQLLSQKADEENQTLAQFVRAKLDIDLKDKPRVRKKRADSSTFSKADPQLLYHLSKIGNNLNQIAFKVNSGKFENGSELVAALTDLRDTIYEK